jgi:hypothetical protein
LRLLNGAQGPAILPWLNDLPEAAHLETNSEGLRFNDQNLSDWRKGGYQDWLKRAERTDRIKELSNFAVKLVGSGKNIADGAAQIASGQVLELLEALDEANTAPEDEAPEARNVRLAAFAEISNTLSLVLNRLRKGDHTAEQLQLNRERLAQDAESLKLAKQKFQLDATKLLLEKINNEQARSIASANTSNEEKIDKLGELIFGEDWEGIQK